MSDVKNFMMHPVGIRIIYFFFFYIFSTCVASVSFIVCIRYNGFGDGFRSNTELLYYRDDDDPSGVIPYNKSKSVASLRGSFRPFVSIRAEFF